MNSIQNWLNEFTTAISNSNENEISNLFQPNGYWRDYLPFGWTLQTIEGSHAIGLFGASHGKSINFRVTNVDNSSPYDEGFFSFTTNDGVGRGHIRLEEGLCNTFFTMLEDIPKGNQECNDDPYVLVVGGGQSGLALGAQLQDIGVSYQIVDKYPRVGDQWRSRYKSLVLHDPVWYDHMPFIPFPDDWPVFTPKNLMGDWLENYADELKLKIWTDTELTSAKFEETESRWQVKLLKANQQVNVKPTHLVFALGLSGFPRIPKFSGHTIFQGPQMHSSKYQGGEEFSDQDVIIVGANNSAHDIAVDLVECGARPVMIQRSSTLVVNQTDYCERILGPLYSAEAVANGIGTDKADILQASMPLKLLEKNHKVLWDEIRKDRSNYYKSLTDSGFKIDFAEDGTGLAMKYRRTASGYYIDVGGSQMVIDGRIAIHSGHGISHLSESTVHLENGDELPADAVVYATGYGDMTDWVAALIDRETAEKVGRCWGYGSGTKGDPSPWIGELRNMWVKTAQQGLWFTGGNLSQARFFSRLLALQLLKEQIN